MSGIAGVVHFDGAPAGAAEIEPMLRELARRGPDGREVRVSGQAVLGSTLLRVANHREQLAGPLTFDGNSSIVADARLDGVDELLRKLRNAGRDVASDASDTEIILHAFHAWDRAALEHLLGDFSFAIWQAKEGRLFCARDHFGIRPFFWWPSPDGFRFANSLKALEVSRASRPDLNEHWIGDFLVFGESLAPEPTIWSGIRRLPAAHALDASAGGVDVRPYWRLQADVPLVYPGADNCVEEFVGLLEQATADRLHADTIAVEMSGGLDSTSVAAMAHRLLQRQGSDSKLRAYTMVTDSLAPDPERAYAELVARSFGLPWQCFDSDRYELYANFMTIASEHGEPWHETTCAFKIDMTREVAAQTRVVLTGWDGDAWLSESPRAFLRALAGSGHWGQAARGAAAYALSGEGALLRSIRSRFARTSIGPASTEFPGWLQPDFERTSSLRERWRARTHKLASPLHPVRPQAFRAWEYLERTSSHFEGLDPGFHLQPVQYRHPLMDKRLVEFCVALPPLPWCLGKRILRDGMRGALPPEVLERPKTAQGSAWATALLARDAPRFRREFVPGVGISRFVDVDALRLNWSEGSVDAQWRDMRVATLDMWLRSRSV